MTDSDHTHTAPRYITSLDMSSWDEATTRSIVVLGSTGSIGRNALDVISRHKDRFMVLGLAGARNISLLAEQAARFQPPYLAVLDANGAKELRDMLPAGYSPEILVGPDGYAAMAGLYEAEMVLSAQVGSAGLPCTLAAAKNGKIIALANKESLVCAGDLIREECRKSGAILLPVDSEHNALFQALAGHEIRDLRRLILTASGGPFRGKNEAFLKTVTREQALAHPNWTMGAKISIDSATLMNKGLEVIEAHHLFGLAPELIEVVVHPQSIVHSLAEYHDGSMLAHLGPPDMRIAIAHCLAFPCRLDLPMDFLDLAKLASLTFEEPDLATFPCLALAWQALHAGGGHTVVLNAANEIAVERFLADAIGFMDIPRLVDQALSAYDASNQAPPATLEDIQGLDQETRQRTAENASALAN